MHNSAKRGLVIACRPSVCPSVKSVDCDYIGWKSWKLIARAIFALRRPNAIRLFQGELRTWGNFGETTKSYKEDPVELDFSPIL